MVKHFTRTFLLSAAMRDAWVASPLDSVTVHHAHAWWLPDQSNSMEPIGDWTLGRARAAFGISPLLLSMLSCLAHGLSPKAEQALLSAPPHTLDEIVLQWEEWRRGHPTEEDCWPPTLQDLANGAWQP